MDVQIAEQQLVGKVFHLGAGRQSSIIAEMIVEGDLSPVDLVIFADTGDEPQWVYDQVTYLRERLESVSIPLDIVHGKHPAGGICEAIKSGLRFASVPMFTGLPGQKKGMLRRQCTYEWKILPAQNRILDWLLANDHAKRRKGDGRRRVNSKVYIEQWFGIAIDETYRAKERGAKWQKAVYPLIDKKISTKEGLRYLEKLGLPIPKKSSCRICPYHDDGYWLDLKINYPEDFAHACSFDRWLRSEKADLPQMIRGLRQEVYLHSSCYPLEEVDFVKGAERLLQRQLYEEQLDTGKCEGAYSCFS